MKIGTITFHSSYNFGSNLQSYALQQYVKKIFNNRNSNAEYKIINLRTINQKNIYDYKSDNSFFKRMVRLVFLGKKLKRRKINFESFINNYLSTTKEYASRDDIIKGNDSFDICISGSDQIWNLKANDFDWSYFLDGIKCKRKISYAVSSGPRKIELSIEEREKIKKLIKDYDYISVREDGTKKFVSEFTDKEIEINMDPTILLTKTEWEEIINKEKLIDVPYIFYYSLKPSYSRIKYLKKISKKMNMKIVVAYPAFKYEIMSGFIKKYDSGPLDFLNLIKNAKLVISSSFHGTIFSIILNVPFYALNGKNDYRISTLLKTIGLEKRMILENDDLDKINEDAFQIDFNEANKAIDKEREKSKRYLIKALELGDK